MGFAYNVWGSRVGFGLLGCTMKDHYGGSLVCWFYDNVRVVLKCFKDFLLFSGLFCGWGRLFVVNQFLVWIEVLQYLEECVLVWDYLKRFFSVLEFLKK